MEKHDVTLKQLVGDDSQEIAAENDAPHARASRSVGKRGPRQPVNRPVPWAGGITEREAARPGSALLSMLLQGANDKGLRLSEMAIEVGVTQGYISQLRNGLRNVPDVSDEFLAGCARFLGVPRLVCAAAAGKVSVEDFYAETNPEESAKRTLRLVQKDSVLGGLMPIIAFAAPAELQLYLVLLYETATGKKLIGTRMTSLASVVSLPTGCMCPGHRSRKSTKASSGNVARSTSERELSFSLPKALRNAMRGCTDEIFDLICASFAKGLENAMCGLSQTQQASPDGLPSKEARLQKRAYLEGFTEGSRRLAAISRKGNG